MTTFLAKEDTKFSPPSTTLLTASSEVESWHIKLSTSTLADWVGVCGVHLQPPVDALREAILKHDVLHADETPVTMLRPDTGKQTHRAYLWAYAPGVFEDTKAVVYDFAPSRVGEHARAFLGEWRGNLVVGDYAGYKHGFSQGITEIGCLAHARRKFFDLHVANQSQLAKQALDYIGELYEIERETKAMDATERWRIRQEKAKPIADKLHAWMLAQRLRVVAASKPLFAVRSGKNRGDFRSRQEIYLSPIIALARYCENSLDQVATNRFLERHKLEEGANGR